MQGWLFMLTAIIGEVVGTTALKSSESFTRLGPSIVTIVAYGIAFYFLSLALKTIPVGLAYASWGGIGIVLIAVLGWLYHGEKLDAWAILGIALILAGTLVMNLLSKSTAH